MMSRVEELQRMCDNINENGGLDSGEWHTALLAQIAQNLAVIADVMMADRNTEPTTEDSSIVEPQISPSDCKTCKHNPWSTPRTCGKCIRQEDGRPSMYEPEDEPQKKCHRDEEYACHLYPNEGACNNCKLWYEDEPQTKINNGLQLFADILFNKDKANQFLEECKTIGIEP